MAVQVDETSAEGRPLDFVVAGVARSGTTAVANYLSATNEVLCGVELFGPNVDHSRILAPQCFLDRAAKSKVNPANPRRIRHTLAAAEQVRTKGDAIRAYGNKTPAYVYRLKGILSEIGHPRAILCTRLVEDVATSFVRRARNPKDNFNKGRVGIYAAGDAALMAQGLLEIDPATVLITPNRALKEDWQATMARVLEFIAPGVAVTWDDARIEKVLGLREERATLRETDKLELSDQDREAVGRIQRSGLDALLDRDRPFLLSEVADQLPGILEALPKDPIKFVARRAKQHPDPAVADFLPTWRDQARRALRKSQEATADAPDQTA